MGTLLVLVSLVFATRGGLMFLDVVDYFANNFGLITIALVEVVTIGLISPFTSLSKSRKLRI